MLRRLPVVALLSLSACASTTEDQTSTAAELSSSPLADLVAHQPYVGSLAIPGSGMVPAIIVIAERPSPELAGTSIVQVCTDGLETCEVSPEAPTIPFTLDQNGAHWEMNIRSDRNARPTRTHVIEYSAAGVPSIHLDLPENQATPFSPK